MVLVSSDNQGKFKGKNVLHPNLFEMRDLCGIFLFYYFMWDTCGRISTAIVKANIYVLLDRASMIGEGAMVARGRGG